MEATNKEIVYGLGMGSRKKTIVSYKRFVIFPLAVLAFFLILFLLSSNNASAETMTLQPGSEGKDAYIFQLTSTTNYGGGSYLYSGESVGYNEMTFIEFDVSGIPSGSTINSAELQMYCSGRSGNSGVYLYQVVTDSSGIWDEYSVIWNSAPYWYSSYVDYAYISSTPSWQAWDVANLVQAWVGGTTNHGMALKSYNWDDGVEFTFYSSDHSSSSYRPKLVVDYSPPAPDFSTSLTSVLSTMESNDDDYVYIRIENNGGDADFAGGHISVISSEFDIIDWEGREESSTANGIANGYEFVEWYDHGITGLSSGSVVDWWVQIKAKHIGTNYIYYRSWAKNGGSITDMDPRGDGGDSGSVSIPSPAPSYYVWQQAISVDCNPPVVSFAVDDSTPNSLQAITFDASASYDPYGGSLEYLWIFDDESDTQYSAYFEVVYHTFWSADTYGITLKVRNQYGKEAQLTKYYSVTNGYGGSGLTTGEKATLESLAKMYSPVLMVHPTADYNVPGPISQILSNSALKEKDLIEEDPTIYSNPTVNDLMALSGANLGDSEGYFLEEYDDNDKGDDPTTYVHFRKDSGNYFIQYWFFYYFNDGPNNHEGDFEMVQISLDSDYNPIRATYSQHTNAWPARFNWGEKRDWMNVAKYITGNELTNHPLVYVSSGTGIHNEANSHANYFYLTDGPSTDYTDDCTMAVVFEDSDLIFLPNLEDDLSLSQWMDFGWVQFGGLLGHWVSSGYSGDDGAQGPGFRTFENSGFEYKMWTHPFNYESGRKYDGEYDQRPLVLHDETNLKLDTNINVVDKNAYRGTTVVLEAYLDYSGSPLNGKVLYFYINSELVGQDITDSNGYASYNYDTSGKSIGTYDVRVAYKEEIKDYAWSDGSGTLTIVNNPPTCQIASPNGDGWYTGTIPITATASDTDGSITEVQFHYSLDGAGWNYIGYDSLSPYQINWDTGSITDPTVWVRCRAFDDAGDSSEDISDSPFGVDNSPPTGSILVNDDDAWTSSTSVTLSLTYTDSSGSGVSQVRYSNDGIWDTESWESPASTKSWTLSAGDGTKSVYYQMKDNVGVTSSTYFDSIGLDTTLPTGSISINDGDSWTSTTSVTIHLTYTDGSGSGVYQVRYSNDGTWDTEPWESPSSTKAWTLTSGDGMKTAYYQIKDNVGWTSSTYSDAIGLDTTAPTGSLAINDGDDWTSSTSVTLSLSYTDGSGSGVYQVRYSNDGTWDTEPWESPVSTKSWILTSGDGTKTVYYQIKDNLGWMSSTYSDSIKLETAPPQPPTNPTAEIWGANIALNWTSSTSGDLSYYLVFRSTDPENFDFDNPYSNSSTDPGWDDSLSTSWNDTAAYGDTADYYYIVRAVDQMHKQDSNTVRLAKINIPLANGWDMFSIPVEQSNTLLEKVLISIDGQYDKVKRYDASTHIWQDSTETLTNIDHEMGMWIHLRNNVILKVTGKVLDSCTIHLYEGMNVVGYPSITIKNLGDALDGISWDKVYSYNGSDQGDSWKNNATYKLPTMIDLDNMVPGHSYWINVTTEGDWILSNNLDISTSESFSLPQDDAKSDENVIDMKTGVRGIVASQNSSTEPPMVFSPLKKTINIAPNIEPMLLDSSEKDHKSFSNVRENEGTEETSTPSVSCSTGFSISLTVILISAILHSRVKRWCERER